MDSAMTMTYIRKSLHQLAQPMAAVTGMVDLLLLQLDQQDTLFQEVQVISTQLDQVLTIIGEIRRLAREANLELAEEEPEPGVVMG